MRTPRVSDRPDDEIIAASEKDPGLFVSIFDRHGRAVHAYLSRRAGTQVADELLGEIWLQALRSRERYRSEGADARPWLYGIAKNVLRSHWRTYRDLRLGALDSTSCDTWADVDDRIDAHNQTSAVKQALATLQPDDREVLLLVAWEELSPSEVATMLEVPAGTVRWRLYRARAQLKEQLVERPAEPTQAGARKVSHG